MLVIKMDLQIKWNEENYKKFLEYLNSLADAEYCKFNSKIINDDTVKYIGVRTPQLRKIAKIIAKNDFEGFMKHNKHKFYEERALHGFIIGYVKVNYETLMNMIQEFIPFLSSWALVDMFVCKFSQIKNNQDEALKEIIKYTKSDNPWEIRLGLIMLLSQFIHENYIEKVLEVASSVKNEHYYVKMGNAWLISECYIKFPEKTTEFLKAKVLDFWTQNKAIQKVRESLRVSKENKDFLNTLKIKLNN